MSDSNVSPENVSALIEKLLKTSDPATVGLRRIIKNKKSEAKTYPLQDLTFKPIESADKKTKIFSEEERRVMELEKELVALKHKLNMEKKKRELEVNAASNTAAKKAFDEGKNEGYQQAVAEHNQKLDAVQSQVTEFVLKVEKAQKKIFTHAEHLVVRLANTLAKKIIHTELQQNPDIAVGTVKRALTHIADREKVVIRVAPDDYERVSERKEFWMPTMERSESVIIEKDDRVDRGGCIVESNDGIVDARLGVQFSELQELIESTWTDAASALSDTDELSAEPEEEQ